jgi:NAD(P)H-dependent flavin oxidoreductase YrpB (nitropropane dioxygenase family)
LIPSVVDIVKGHKSPLTGDPVFVVAAGGIYDSRGLAACLSMGAQGVWVGTRFVACKEAGAPPAHQQAVIRCGLSDTIRTTIFTGRPMRVIKNEYIMEWETNRADEIKKLLKEGKIPYTVDVVIVLLSLILNRKLSLTRHHRI